jgi:hypothetical protein
MAMQRIQSTGRLRPDVVVEASERAAQAESRVYPGEQWPWTIHTERDLLPDAGNIATLKRMLMRSAAALDVGRIYGLEVQNAYLRRIHKVLSDMAGDRDHNVEWSWPILGIADAGSLRRRSTWAPAETAALTACRKDEATLLQAKQLLSKQPAAHAAPHAGGPEAALEAAVKGELRNKKKARGRKTARTRMLRSP